MKQPGWIRILGPLLLKLLPPEFRGRYGDDLLLALEDLRRDPWRNSGGRSWLPFPLLALFILVKTGVAERAHPPFPLPIAGRFATRAKGHTSWTFFCKT